MTDNPYQSPVEFSQDSWTLPEYIRGMKTPRWNTLIALSLGAFISVAIAIIGFEILVGPPEEPKGVLSLIVVLGLAMYGAGAVTGGAALMKDVRNWASEQEPRNQN